ncbi:YitT family protein [Mycoplasmopsis columbinasalis]|uniref:Uncharacterized BCR, YitT family COG1284 n=1 Tax=Mycoplasmopsis columbinasalis TaxID=114880 RepID=A0A449BA48_9BACT|nr:YitT family protein [Mycoplasmopsis columbinasalis]VEU78071.1 Uncharacterized BCR, YitT family COG1284 [Mycoplasmopsis columbinasalis]
MKNNDDSKKNHWKKFKQKLVCTLNKNAEGCSLKSTENFEEENCDFNKTKIGKYAFSKTNRHDKNVKKERILLYARRIFFIFISAILFNFGVLAFLQKSDTIPSGISGIPSLIVFLLNRSNPEISKFFALMYLAANIPLFAIFGFKVKRSFVVLSVLFMIFQIAVNAVLTIKEVETWVNHTFSVSPGWEQMISVEVQPNVFQNYENPNTWPIFMNGIIGSALIGISIAIAWKNGGSTGGTDIIAYYFSTKKKKSVSFVLMIVSFLTSAIFLILFSALHPHTASLAVEFTNVNGKISPVYKVTNNHAVFGMREIMTIFYIFIVNFLVSFIYPKYKKVDIEIFTADPKKILNYLKAINYWHAYTVYTAQSGYTGNPVYKVETTSLLLESKSLIKDLQWIDKSAWIKIKPVVKVNGSFSTEYVE